MGARFYRMLVRLMPTDFRREYGEEMCRVAEEQWRDGSHGSGRLRSGLFWTRRSVALVRGSACVRLSRGFFEAIGSEAMLGRTFIESDYDQDGSSAAVLGHRAWTSRFASDPSIVGQPLTLDGQALTVLGVMSADFRFPDATEAWIPRIAQPWDEEARPANFMTGVTRLAEGVTFEQAGSEADRIAATLRAAHPGVNGDLGYDVVPLREHLFGEVRSPLVVIMAAVLFVLLIACANVAGLMLARGLSAREISPCVARSGPGPLD